MSNELVAELARRVAALPVLARHVEDVSQDVERSVIDVCSSFLNIAQLARRNMAVSAVEATGPSEPAYAAAALARQILLDWTDDLARYRRSTERLGLILQQLEARDDGSPHSERMIIARVRAELSGLVADETRHLGAMQQEAAQSQRRLGRIDEEIQVASDRATRQASELTCDIERAVVGLQFQDAVTQRLGRVAALLREIERTLVAQLARTGLTPDAGAGSWAAQIAEQYTMAAERRAHAEETGTAHDSSRTAGDAVELF